MPRQNEGSRRFRRNVVPATVFACLGSLVAGMGMQMVGPPAAQNPAAEAAQKVEAALQTSTHMEAILNRACKDCHSNSTRWPWYSRLAPISWVIAHDVKDGRAALNFSEWSTIPGARAVGALAASCAAVQSHQMPPASYLALHAEAKLSPNDIQTFCAWTRQKPVTPDIRVKTRLSRSNSRPRLAFFEVSR
jgi:Haem-binding domain